MLNFSSGKPNVFLTGAGIFAIAHIFFFLAFFQFEKFRIPDLIWSVIFGSFLIWLITQEQWFKQGKMTTMLIGYSIILSFMVSKSFSIWKYRKVNRTFVYMTISATILFMLSDIILLIACFSISGADNRLKALNNFVYSISVALLGFSFKWELLPETLDSHH